MFAVLGDLALLVDTSHPMIRPELENALEKARKILQARKRFCVQVNQTHVYRLKIRFYVQVSQVNNIS